MMVMVYVGLMIKDESSTHTKNMKYIYPREKLT